MGLDIEPANLLCSDRDTEVQREVLPTVTSKPLVPELRGPGP